MCMRVFLDIETIPGQQPGIREEIAANVRPPANYKKEDSIRAWLEENREAETDRLYRATALDGSAGELIAVGLAVEDDPATVFMRRLGEPEAAVLLAVFAFLQEEVKVRNATPWQVEWIGWNVAWDLRFLWQRSVIRGIRPPVALRQDARPGSEFVADLMPAWAGWGQRCSLDAACKALGLASPKEQGDGSKVWGLTLAGEYEALREYCRGDVEAVRLLHRRFNFEEAA